jgi:type II secretory pathway pseudopilin PulG
MAEQLTSMLNNRSLPGCRSQLSRRPRIGQAERRLRDCARLERGSSLIETLVAAGILIVVVAGLLPVFILATQTTYAQGDVATRVTEYAQDKMEQLLSLNKDNIISDGFNDGTTDTTVFPAAVNALDGTTSCTGTSPNICGLGGGSTVASTCGLGGGSMAPNSTVGSIPPAAPVTYFVDYLDTNGNLLPNSTGAYYTRQWQVSLDSTSCLKTITVVASSVSAGLKGGALSVKLVAIKAANL